MKQVAITIPTYVRTEDDLEIVSAMLSSLRAVEPEVRTIVVDDGSPAADIRRKLAALASDYKCEMVLRDENAGFATTVNVGIRLAMADGMDVILANADLVFDRPFVDTMREQRRLDGGGLAEVVGALLVYPQPRGLIQHAGQYFSLLTRTFGHVYQFAPEELPEAQRPAIRPVTHALALLRHEVLCEVGLLDESFRLGHEDVDFNVRVLRAGGQCVYQPTVRAWHCESIFRGREDDKIRAWHIESWAYFREKWREENLVAWVPTI